MHSHRMAPWLPNHGAHTKPALAGTWRRVGVSIDRFLNKINNNRNSDVCPKTMTILLTFSNIVTKIVLNYKAEFIIEI